MNIIEAIILGLVQGFTEFLPVSSSGHLELFQKLFGVNPETHLSFDVVVHLATTISVLIVYRKDIYNLIYKGLIKQEKYYLQYILMLIISAIPVGIVGVFFEDKIEAFFQGNLLLLGFAFLFTAGMLYLNKFVGETSKKLDFKSAFLIGVAQVIALIPGVSRSGTTITAALLQKIEREEAARFSFLMMIAPILGASLLKAKDITSLEISPVVLFAGFITALVSGVFACIFIKRLVETKNFYKFSYYLVIVALITLFLAFKQ